MTLLMAASAVTVQVNGNSNKRCSSWDSARGGGRSRRDAAASRRSGRSPRRSGPREARFVNLANFARQSSCSLFRGKWFLSRWGLIAAAGRRRGDEVLVGRCRCACHNLFFLSFLPRVSHQFFLRDGPSHHLFDPYVVPTWGLFDSSSFGPNLVSMFCLTGALGVHDHLCASAADSGADCWGDQGDSAGADGGTSRGTDCGCACATDLGPDRWRAGSTTHGGDRRSWNRFQRSAYNNALSKRMWVCLFRRSKSRLLRWLRIFLNAVQLCSSFWPAFFLRIMCLYKHMHEWQSASEWNLCVIDAMDADLGSWSWIVRHSTFCCFVGAVCPNCFHHDLHWNNCRLHSGGFAAAHHVLDSCARAQMSFSTYRSGGNLVLILDFSISVLRQLLLSFVHADSPLHRTAGRHFMTNQPISSPRAPSSRSRLLQTWEAGMWTQIVFEGKTDRVHLMNGRTLSMRQSWGASRARCRDPNQLQRLADDYSSDDGEDASGQRCSKATYPYHLR